MSVVYLTDFDVDHLNSNMDLKIERELSAMGFKGFLLNNLISVIVDEDTLHSFFNFILKIEEEEGEITKVLLVHRFIKFMQDRQSFADYDEFKAVYTSANTILDKREVLAKLFLSDTDELKKVVLWVNGSMISLKKLYHFAVEYRSQYNVRESLILIESMCLD